jgi:hypothetical protein
MTTPSWPGGREHDDGWRSRGLRGRAAYEDAAVRRVLARFNLRPLARELAAESHERVGESYCTFAAAELRLPTLPIRLRVGDVRALRRLTVPDLFDRFSRTPICLAFDELLDAEGLDPLELPVGMIFRWSAETTYAGREGREVRRGIRGGKFMALHNYPATREPGDATTRIVRGHRGLDLEIQTMDSMLDRIAGWQAD